ncbi:nicotinamide N-methyltransferase [Sarracenia purpurea var. burkii]
MCSSKLSGGMGFRDMKAFNLAMLAKQGWRILTYPNLLVSKVLKAKYFPYNTFLNARLGNNPSYTWRSILDGRNTLYKGLRWRVGSGRSIRIWEDKWVPRPSNFQIISPKNQNASCIKVEELIRQEDGQWDVELLQHLLPLDVDFIRKIPLAPHMVDDCMVWHYTGSGRYSVKSGYHLELGSRSSNPECSNSLRMESFWKKLWAASVPNKVKCFAWKAFRNCLPVMENLYLRKIRPNPWCEICKKERKSVIHCLKECKIARKVWLIHGETSEQGKQILNNDILLWAMERAEALKHKDWEIFLMIIWGLWNQINNATFGGKCKGPTEILGMVRDYLAKFQKDNVQMQRAEIGNQSDGKWDPPKTGWHKVNFDGALRKNGKAGIGIVIRDELGWVTASYMERLKEQANAEVTEAIGGHRAIEIAISLGLKKIHLRRCFHHHQSYQLQRS